MNVPDLTVLTPAEKRILLARMLREREQATKEYPLSFTQQRFWFIGQLLGNSQMFHVPAAWRIRGNLDRGKLEAAFNEVLQRHEILRTTFQEREGSPVQVVQPFRPLQVRCVDTGAMPDEERERELERIISATIAAPFELSDSPPLRVRLVRAAEQEHLLLFTLHHIIADGWSVAILMREIAEAYAALAAGRAVGRNPQNQQFGEFAAEQRQRFRDGAFRSQLEYWRRQLCLPLPILDLPVDFQRPRVQATAGLEEALRLPPGVSSNLKLLNEKTATTPFMVLVACAQVLLSRYTGQDDILVGCPIANRNHREWEGLVGPLVNTIVIRNRLAGNPVFSHLLSEVREAALSALANQELPFEALVDELRPDRDISRNPLFQVLFVFQNMPAARLELPGLTLERMNVASEGLRFDLEFHMSEQNGEFGGFIKYNTSIFRSDTIARLARNYETVMAAAISRPETHLGDLTLLADSESRHFEAWNHTSRPWPNRTCLHELFEAQAAARPNAVAVISDEVSLTYGELFDRVRRRAAQLRALGVGHGSLVSIYVARSAEMIESVLAVLRCGAAYVPFDDAIPPSRIEHILGCLDCQYIIADSAHAAMLEKECATPRSKCMLLVDGPPPATADGTPLPEVDAGDLAYIIFTSGSTGQPKGVAMSHRAVVNVIDWVNREYAVGASDRILFVSSLCFDLSVYDIFGILAAGGAVRIAPQSAIRDMDRLWEMIAADRLTFWDSAPALMDAFIAEDRGTSLDCLRLVFLSGDWIPVTLPEKIRKRFPSAQIVALGGATEAAIWSNYHAVGEVQPEWSSIPYGKPIQNARYYVLDRFLNPCPIGVPGDLYIAGDCLALGYWGDSVLTAERFLPEITAKQPGARMYATGDRARYGRDGTLEFLGRLDDQVKIRGFRVDLGDVETALRGHPDLRQVAVIADGLPGAGRKLMAFVVAAPGAVVDPAGLFRFLRQRVPEYMVPSEFIFLAALPLTQNGKVARRQLSATAPRVARPKLEAPPENALLQQIAAIWTEVLGIENVGVDENFFEVGGNSLLMIRVRALLKSRLNRHVSMVDLFTYATIHRLAAVVTDQSTTTESSPPAIDILRGRERLSSRLHRQRGIDDDQQDRKVV
jgi:amino acid adenylation domain-containing protein